MPRGPTGVLVQAEVRGACVLWAASSVSSRKHILLRRFCSVTSRARELEVPELGLFAISLCPVIKSQVRGFIFPPCYADALS